MRKVLIIFFIFIPYTIFSQYSVMSNGTKVSDYYINNQRTSLPVFLKVEYGFSKGKMEITRKGRKGFFLDFVLDGDKWIVNDKVAVYKGNVIGLGLDFATDKIYILPVDLIERISKTLTASDIMIIDDNSSGIKSIKFGVLLVDIGKLRRERIDSFAILYDNSDILSDKLYKTPGAYVKDNEDLIPARPILNAAVNAQIDLLNRLIQNGENINELNPVNGNNALMGAIYKGDNEISNILIKSGIDLKHKNRYGQTALHVAAESGNYIATQTLLALGLSPSAQDNAGNTPLMYASATPSYQVVNLLIGSGADLNSQNINGMTALGFASQNGNSHTVSILISKGASYTIADKSGETPVSYAIKNENNDMLQSFLINIKESNIKDSNGDTPLHVAAISDNVDAARLLLSKDADINIKNNDGDTPLMLALKDNSLNVAKELLRYNPDLYIINNSGETAYDIAVKNDSMLKDIIIQRIIDYDNLEKALFDAVYNGDLDTAKHLLDNGVKPDAIDATTENTPLIVAVSKGDKRMTELLLKKGADVNRKNIKGNTPLIVSITSGDERLLAILINNGALIDLRNQNGDTALLWAAKLKRSSLLRILLFNGADPNIKNYEGITPMAIVKSHNDVQGENLLKTFGSY